MASVVAVALVAGCGLRELVRAVTDEATKSETFRHTLLNTLVDKLVLGGVVVVIGYVVQWRMEIFKRNQALAVELAKAQIAVYNATLSAALRIDFIVTHYEDNVLENRLSADEKTRRRTFFGGDLNESCDDFVKSLTANSYLLGPRFTEVAANFIIQVQEDASYAEFAAPPAASEIAERLRKRKQTRDVLVSCLPPFARAPTGDVHFMSPQSRVVEQRP